jgi:hypothetical protein
LHDIDDGIEARHHVGIADQFSAPLGEVADVAGACAYADDHNLCVLVA